MPVPKVAKPAQPSDYRPMSITAVLSHLPSAPEGLDFNDQFGFRPTGLNVAALIALLSMLSTNAYVRVFALDFSKAFDTVRHAVLMEKMTTLCLSDKVYNWIKDFF